MVKQMKEQSTRGYYENFSCPEHHWLPHSLKNQAFLVYYSLCPSCLLSTNEVVMCFFILFYSREQYLGDQTCKQ
jgi:hypothetical protein